MRPQERFFSRNLVQSKGHAGYIIYFNALQMIRDELPKAGGKFRGTPRGRIPIAHFACGAEPSSGEITARQVHAIAGFPTVFAQIDFKNAVLSHQVDALQNRSAFGGRIIDSYVPASIFDLKPGIVSRSLGLKEGVKAPFGLSVALLDYYPLEDKKELISRMLEHCGSLVCHVKIGKPPARRPGATPLKLRQFASVDELKRNLVHENWRVEKVSPLELRSRCTENDYLVLVKPVSKRAEAAKKRVRRG
jgi:hypothetical protein